jgi:hypothetical protein
MPSSEYSATDVVQLVCEGLKNNDVPKADNGVERYYNFLTPQGRVALAPPPPKNGTQGGVTLDFFVANAGSPAFGALVSCTSFRLLGDARITPGSIARGSLCTQMIEVGNSPLEDQSSPRESLLALAKAPDDFLEAIIASVRAGTELPRGAPAAIELKRRFWVQLEQQRRPPQQGCWFIKEMMPLEKSQLQKLIAAGEEFEGDA